MSNKSTAKGTTVIVHAIREKLGLSVQAYVFCDTIYQIELETKKPAQFSQIESVMGHIRPFNDTISYLFSMKIISANDIKNTEGMFIHTEFTTTDLWKKEFDVNADFEEFWLIWQRRAKNKTKTLAKYIKARKKVDKETLHRRARLVAESASEWKFIPHAEGWLDNERWNEFNPKFDTPDTTTETKQQGFDFVG
jgi:hypothetical protein